MDGLASIPGGLRANTKLCDVVRFVRILSKARGVRASLTVTFPSDGEWLVRVIASEGQFVGRPPRSLSFILAVPGGKPPISLHRPA